MRHATHIRRRYRLILSYSGFIWLVTGLIIALPVAVLPFYWVERSTAWGFLVPGLALALTGYLVWRRWSPAGLASLSLHEGAVIVVLVWISAILTGAVPFMLVEGLTFTQAIFESTSGWSTTGLSVVDVTTVSPLTLLYRSLIQFAGGAGFAIIMVSLLSSPAGIGFTTAEGRIDQVEPHVRRSASLVMQLYLAYTLLGALALYLAGMSGFDAVNHAFTAVSTGGFSTRIESIGYWNSPLVELVVIGLMLLGTTSFLTVYALLQGRIRPALRSAELHLMAALLLVTIPLLWLAVSRHLYPVESQAWRTAVFEIVSALSTTGFSTVSSYTDWRPLGWLLLISLMLIGGGGGSTAGGMKQYRAYIVLTGIAWEFRRSLRARGALNEPVFWSGERPHFLEDKDLRQVALFAALHLIAFLLIAAVIAGYGHPLHVSLFEAASTVSTVGLSAGVTGAQAPVMLLWAQIGGMILGRLEYTAIVIGLIKLVDDALTTR
jgi:trk system potassium uptake protein